MGPDDYVPEPETLGLAEEIAETEKLVRDICNEPASFDDIVDEADFIDFEEEW